MTPTQARLAEERQARLARFAAAGRSEFDRDICLRRVDPEPVQAPLPIRRIRKPLPPPTPQLVTLPNSLPFRLSLHIITIQGAVCEKFGLTRATMIGPMRTRAVSRPRQIAMFLTKEFLPQMSLPQIGRKFGGKDHTSVLHAVRGIAALIKRDPVVAAQVEELRATISAARAAA